MSIQYLVLGFELTNFRYESPPLTTRPGLLAVVCCCAYIIIN